MALLSRAGRRAFFCGLLMMGVGTFVSVAQEPQAAEPQIKAAFLINFPKYVDWPAEAFAATNSPIVIAVLGETPVAEALQRLIMDRTINGRGLLLRRLAAREEIGACHVLFITAAELQRSPNLLAKPRPSVLTVGESDNFLESGGVINLARRSQKIALEVNVPAAENAGIKISSKLLNISTVMKGKSK